VLFLVIKTLFSAALIVAISEIAKRSAGLGGLLASLPVISLFAMIWLYVDTGDTEKIAQLSFNIFWLVLPSLPLFLALPWLLHRGMGFYPALGISLLVVACGYFVVGYVLQEFFGQSF
jgi:hypothetical protein